ncbi:MAG: SDR family oxidoreductase [Burkholderiales bacterium]|nr:SDR family oxidoreductase [Burkholderiales bacterium]MDE2455918.1 SDR family oxidoreductase [Burkholderiales bacterium]
MSGSLNGRRIWLTGAGGGIGRAIATELARQGARLALADPDPRTLDGLVNELQGKGHEAFALAIDVRERASVQAASEAVVARWGGYDALACNAGVSTMRPALELGDEDWDFNFAVNARGTFLVNQIAARQFVANQIERGCIVNTASLAAKVGAPLLAHYSASKFAVAGWTQSLARELAPLGIRVNAVCPGFVRTAMQAREVQWEAELRGLSPEQVLQGYIAQTPLGRLEEPEDVAGVVAFLMSDAARFMTGQSINVTGGVFMQ